MIVVNCTIRRECYSAPVGDEAIANLTIFAAITVIDVFTATIITIQSMVIICVCMDTCTAITLLIFYIRIQTIVDCTPLWVACVAIFNGPILAAAK